MLKCWRGKIGGKIYRRKREFRGAEVPEDDYFVSIITEMMETSWIQYNMELIVSYPSLRSRIIWLAGWLQLLAYCNVFQGRSRIHIFSKLSAFYASLNLSKHRAWTVNYLLGGCNWKNNAKGKMHVASLFLDELEKELLVLSNGDFAIHQESHFKVAQI